MNKVIIASMILSLMTSFQLHARENCEVMAVSAAEIMSKQINGDDLPNMMRSSTVANDRDYQVVEVTFDNMAKGGGMSITYTVTIERNVSPIEKNQNCMRVSKIELTGEE